MKIISVTQPWACLIVHGHKDVENRTWPTSHRGPVLVHASGKPDRDAKIVVVKPGMSGLVVGAEIVPIPEAHLGGVVGIVDIIDCVTTHSSKWFTDAGYAFVLRNARPLPFVRWKGQLGIRDAPAALIRQLKL